MYKNIAGNNHLFSLTLFLTGSEGPIEPQIHLVFPNEDVITQGVHLWTCWRNIAYQEN